MSKPRLDVDTALSPLRSVIWARNPASTPPTRFDLKAGATTFEPKAVKVQWQLALARLVVAPFGIVVEPAKGNNIILFGEAPEISQVYPALTALLRDLGPLADQEYLAYFYQCKDAGEVEKARGYRSQWIEQTLDLIRTEYLPAPSAPAAATIALLEAYRDAQAEALIKTRVERTPPEPKPRAIPEALVETVEQSKQAGEKQDTFFTRIYRGALEAAGYQETSFAEGVAFNPAIKGFSIVKAMDAAYRRLGVVPNRFRFFNGTLYLSSTTEVPDNPSLTFPEVMAELGQALSPNELQVADR